MKFPVQSRLISELTAMSSPASGQLEAVSWTYFDTQAIVSTTTTTLQFFNTIQSDPTLGNIEQAGTIQSPNWFELYQIKADFLTVPSTNATATAGALNDLAQILNVQRATYTLTVNSKSYGRKPLVQAQGLGGPVGLEAGTPATNAMVSFANNNNGGDQDYVGGVKIGPSGFPQECGSIVFPPNQSFSFVVQMAAAPTLTTTPLNLRISLCGVLHRQVR